MRFLTGIGGAIGGVAVASFLVKGVAENLQAAKEGRRRKSSTPRFDERLTRRAFAEIAEQIGKRTSRVADVRIRGMTITLCVKSMSGLSTWEAEIDFNDYGTLTGRYWLQAENSQSKIPEHFAKRVETEIRSRVQLAQTLIFGGQAGATNFRVAGGAPASPMKLQHPELQPIQPPLPTDIPAGWYPDYTTPHMVRWWDGAQWTEHTYARHS